MKKNTILTNKKASIGSRFYSPYFREYIIVRGIVSKSNWYFSKESDAGNIIRAITPLTYFENNPNLYDRRKVVPEIRDCQFYEDADMISAYKKLLYVFTFILVILGIITFVQIVINFSNNVK